MKVSRTVLAATLGLALAVALAGCDERPQAPGSTPPSHATTKSASTPTFMELSAKDAAELDAKRALVAAELKKRYGKGELTKTKADLALIQKLLDDKAFSKDQADALRSLGVVFGDVLASEMPVKWVMVTDEFGTDPTLRYEETTLQINAMTMISKRVERGDKVDVAVLEETLVKQIPDVAKQYK